MDIGDKHFPTKKSLEEYTRKMIETIGLCPSVRTTDLHAYHFLVDLFRRHPKYPEKVYDMCDLSIVQNKLNPHCFELNILKSNGEVDDISWKNCVSGSGRDAFTSALRVAIDDQIKSFRSTCAIQCVLCNTVDADVFHVDHENHFEEIVYEFLHTTQRNKPTLFQNTDDHRKAFTSNDKDYENEWKSFHKNRARLRLLCRSCNLKRPKWKQVVV